MTRRKILLLALAGVLLLLTGTAAEAIRPEEVVKVRVEPARVKVSPGSTAAFTVEASIKQGFHTNSNQPTLDYLVPTRLELAGASGFTLEKVSYPAGKLKAFGFAPDEKLSVYEGMVKIPARVRAAPGASPGKHTLRLRFHYQACNDQLCLRPASRQAKLTVEVE